MRKLIARLAVFGILLGLAFMGLQAFNPPPDKYGFGKRQAVELTSADTVEIAPSNLTLTYVTLSIDTNVVVNVVDDNSVIGDRIILEVTADASNRQLEFNSNVTALADSVVATKTKLFEFVYNGEDYKGVAEMAVD